MHQCFILFKIFIFTLLTAHFSSILKRTCIFISKQMPDMQSVLSSEDFPLVVTSLQPDGSVNVAGNAGSFIASATGGQTAAMVNMVNVHQTQQQHQQQHHHHQGMIRASGMGGSGGNIRTGGGHVSVRDSVGSAGPIRSNKSRIDTSPYGSDRYSPGGGGYHHLSPPDPSWRRVHSDSSIHHSTGTTAGGVQGVQVVGASPVPIVNQNGAVSPLQASSSPTMIRRGI